MNKLRQTVILFCILLSCSCSLLGKPTKIEYLMPAGFTGGVIILYNQPDGATPEVTKDGTVRYRIPKDGFLKVNTADPEDIYNYSFYYVDEKNNLTRLEYILPKGSSIPRNTNLKSADTVTEDEMNNKVFAMNHRTIGFETRGKSVPMYAFSVGHPKDSTDIYVDIDFRIGEIVEQLSNKRP